MKVVSAKEMAKVEQLAIKNGASEDDFMHQAAKGIVASLFQCHEFYVDDQIILLCGKGNNGGDAYTAGWQLLEMGFNVIAYQIGSIDDCSRLCQINHQIFLDQGGKVKEINSAKKFSFPKKGIILDGLFGTGFHGTVKEPYLSLIKAANASGLPIYSVDIPSGINDNTGEINNEAVHAIATFCLELPKTGFFLQNAWNYVGKLNVIKFGLSDSDIKNAKPDFLLLDRKVISPFIPTVERNRNKYSRGLVVGFAGSPGMPGAAFLSSLSALRGGAGIVRQLHHGPLNEDIQSPPEIVHISFKDPKEAVKQINKGKAAFVGPGIGRSDETKKNLKTILNEIKVPCVLDGDALTLISENKMKIPPNSVLTPHTGELQRLLKFKEHLVIDQKLLKTCQKFAEKHKVTLVLKGSPTFIFHPKEIVSVSIAGDPGMATAGSGDVLTGMIAAFLAQGLPPHHAAQLGVYLHGIAGEYAAREKTFHCVIASDIIDNIPNAFLSLSN